MKRRRRLVRLVSDRVGVLELRNAYSNDLTLTWALSGVLCSLLGLFGEQKRTRGTDHLQKTLFCISSCTAPTALALSLNPPHPLRPPPTLGECTNDGE